MARPPLWDSRLSIKARSKTIRDNLWLEIWDEFGQNPDFPVDCLIKKWRNLRDTYVRLKGEYTPSGSAAKKKKKWEYFELMSFLNDSIKFRPTVSNVKLTPQSSTSSSPLMSSLFAEQGDELETPRRSQPEHPDPKVEKSGVEGAILQALNRINTPHVESSNTVNPICLRISELLSNMPQQARTVLEIKLLGIAYEGAEDYL